MDQLLSIILHQIVEIFVVKIIEKLIDFDLGNISTLLRPAIYFLIYRIIDKFVDFNSMWKAGNARLKFFDFISMWKAGNARLKQVELELNSKRECILTLLIEAEERRYIEDDSVHRWLRDLKALAFDTEDVYDEFENYKKLSEAPIDIWGKFWRKFERRDFADRIQKIRHEYERVLKEKNDFWLQRGEAVRGFNPQRGQFHHQEGSLQDPERFHGRQKEMKEILDELLNLRCSDNVQMISIVGPCGFGKTSLARNIFQVAGLKQEIKDGCSKNHFDLRIWVSLPQKFDLFRTIKEVIKAAEGRDFHDSTLDLLQYHLKNIISGKRFLLVLDNMWRSRLDFWENLLIPLMDGAKGSKILVTTQYENFASSAQSVNTLPSLRVLNLQSLPEEDGWLLLEDLVFSNDKKTVNAFKVPPELEVIGKHIVKECQGFPIAIKAIGILLYSERDENKWEQLSEELMENGRVAGAIIPFLKTSYDHLPRHLKRCFAFCSTFPKDYEFDKEELVKLWIALDLIESSTQIQIEDVGESYFDDLLWRSFFQACYSNMKDRRKYKIPTVIHEVANHLFRYESLRINQDVTEHGESGTARYGLVYQHDKQSITFNKMFENKGLRALVLCGRNGVLMKKVLIDLFDKLRFLRLLDLSSSCLEELPDSVCNLILLRYLNLHGTNIKKLPDRVGNLYGLQTLELGNCHQIQELPDSIGDLNCLRHLGLHNTNVRRLPETVSNLLNLQTLELGNCYRLEMLPRSLQKLVRLRHLGLQLDWDNWDRQIDIISMPPGIGCLTSLRHLSRFAVGSEPQCGLRELQDLRLRGKLCITKLEKVVNANDAEAANLRSKLYIDSLMLRWSDAAYTVSENVLGDVIGQLKPHKDLQNLYVENYEGMEFPNWMRYPSFLKLETLKLINCKNCLSLPRVWNLPSLKTLQIKGLHGVKSFGSVRSGFENLETLDVSEMHNLERWFRREVQMSCLTALYISDCPNLRRSLYLPPSVKTFELRNCPKVGVRDTLPNLKDLVLESDSGSRLMWLQYLPSLTSLTLSKLSRIQDDHKGIFKYLTSLKQLKVQECDDIDSIDGWTNDSSLEYFEIFSCPQLSKIGLPKKLKKFCLRMCPSLTSLPHDLHLLSFLRVMEIQSVPLAAVASLPAGVKNLVIKECSVLSKRCQMNGDDWPNIGHIPYIQVDGISLHKQPVTRSQVCRNARYLLYQLTRLCFFIFFMRGFFLIFNEADFVFDFLFFLVLQLSVCGHLQLWFFLVEGIFTYLKCKFEYLFI